jgi:hypothetical protein
MFETRLDALRDQFSAASSRWPNLHSILILWPEDREPPDEIPEKLSGQYAVPAGETDGEPTYACTLVGTAAMDTPAFRYRAGSAGMLTLRRSFGRFGGDPREITDPDEITACGQRWGALAKDGARHLEAIGEQCGLSANALGWEGYTRWLLAVHETIRPSTRELTEHHWCEVLDDLFLASAQALDVWMGTDAPPRGPVNLSPTEQDLIDVIREIGPDGTRTQMAILDALAGKGKMPSEGTTKIALSAMVRHGVLLPGYRLPEWETG